MFLRLLGHFFLYGDVVVVRSALDFLEEKYFEINIYTGVKKEIDKPKEKVFRLRNGIRRVFWLRDMVILEKENGSLVYVE